MIIAWINITKNTSVRTINIPIEMNVLGYAGIDVSYSKDVGHPGILSYTNTTLQIRFGEAGKIIVIGY